jgi:LysM repeat protein
MGIIHYKVSLVLALLLACYSQMLAQNASKPYTYDGKWVEDITVEKGRTIYNLTKTYKITEEELMLLNPELKNGLRAGMKVRIPSQQKVEKADTIVSKTMDLKGAIKHTVKSKETIYGIARMYGVEVEDLYALNPQINEGLSAGMVLTVYPKPSSRPPSNEQLQVKDTLPADYQLEKPAIRKCSILSEHEKRRTLKVGLFLPFYLNPENEYSSRSRIGLDFLAGARLAADSLKKQGYSLNIHVFDTQNDSDFIHGVFSTPEFAGSDLIIGPLYSQSFLSVADKAKELGIPAISPFSQSAALIDGYPNVIKVTPTDELQMKELATNLIRQFPGAKFTLLTTDLPKDKNLSDSFLASWNEPNKQPKPELTQISFNEFRTNLSSLDVVKQNIVILLSTEEVKLIELTNKLEKLSNKYRIRLVGLQSWNLFDNVDMNLLNKLKFTYVSYLWQNFNSGPSMAFQKRFLDEFKGEPSYYAYQGFDVMHFFCKFIADYGKDSLHCLPTDQGNCGLSICYRFSKGGEKNGYENTGIRLVELNEFREVHIHGNK